MSEVKVEGLVDAESGGINQEHKAALDEAVQLLKNNPGKKVKLGLQGQTKEEQKPVLKRLRATLKQLIKADSSYSAVKLSVQKSGELLNVYLKERHEVKKKAEKKDKKKDKKAKTQDNTVKDDKQKNDNLHAQTVEGAAGQWQPVSNGAGSFAGMKDEMLKSIENMPVQMLPMPLAQYQGILAEKQRQLAAPGTTEDVAGKTKEDIQVLEEVIAAINKRMGQ
jgi:predicted ATP-binding protein involved in virulence